MENSKVRVIVTSTKDGNHEEVIFTHDLKAPIKDFLTFGHTVDIDEEIPDTLPPGFPTEYTLIRS